MGSEKGRKGGKGQSLSVARGSSSSLSWWSLVMMMLMLDRGGNWQDGVTIGMAGRIDGKEWMSMWI